MTITTQHAMIRAYLREENAKYGSKLVEMPREKWELSAPSGVVSVMRSKDFLVQIYAPENGARRLSISRTDIDGEGRWRDGISWDELQFLKSQAGFADRDAVEFFPREEDVVNVANMRHLFVLDEPLACMWRSV